MNKTRQTTAPLRPSPGLRPKEQPSFAVVNQFEVLFNSCTIPADCQSISFKNIGAVDCEISGFPLAAGDAMLTLENPHIRAVDTTRYDLVFKQGVPGSKKLLVCRTFHDFSKTPKQNI
jgi:hypothetical protein